jgi:hypothetical protein
MTYRTQRKVMLPDEVWRETMIQAALENKSASDICEHVLRHYVDTPETDHPPIRTRSASGRQRSIYIDKSVWVQLSGLKVTERRSISAILEQQLRAYMGMKLPEDG